MTTGFRAVCAAVTVVAGLTGVVMLAAPGETDRYFSWPLGPPALATLVGAFYVAAAGLFALLALRVDAGSVRVAGLGVLAFTLPTLVATAGHRDLFDWGRWQALAWAALFVGTPVAFGTFVHWWRDPGARVEGLPAGGGRAALGVLGIAYGLLALGLLLVPGRLEGASPFALPGLSGRFLGSWSAFLAVVALLARRDPGRGGLRVASTALVAWPVAALAAALRSFDDLQPAGRRAAYLALLATAALVAAAAARSAGEAGRGPG